MLDRMKYVNHLNEEIEFGIGNILINTNDLRDYEWAYNIRNNRIVSFEKQMANRTLPVLIIGKNCREEAKRIFEIIEKDVVTAKAGYIEINGYKLSGWFNASSKPDYTAREALRLDLSFVSDSAKWVKETITSFGYDEGEEGKNLDYDNDFPYDYTSNLLGEGIINEGIVSTNFRIRIYGMASNPLVTIQGHDYQVFVDIKPKEYLSIDSIKKTIQLIHDDGTITNCFNLRNRESYIFEKIPAGLCNVSSNASFKFDVTIFEERSEPKWT